MIFKLVAVGFAIPAKYIVTVLQIFVMRLNVKVHVKYL